MFKEISSEFRVQSCELRAMSRELVSRSKLDIEYSALNIGNYLLLICRDRVGLRQLTDSSR